MDEISSVVAKEVIDGNEDVLLLWGLEVIGPLGFRSGRFYRYAGSDRARKETMADAACFSTTHTVEFSVLYSTEQVDRPHRSVQNERSLDMM